MIVSPEALVVFEYVFVVIVSAAIFLAIVWIIALFDHTPARAIAQAGLVFLSVAIVGASAGFIGGLSRVGVAGEIMPAVLGLAGGVSIYLFGVDSSKGSLVGLAAACLAVAVSGSYLVSSSERTRTENAIDARDKCAAAYANPELSGNDKALAVFDAKMGTICTRYLNWN